MAIGWITWIASSVTLAGGPFLDIRDDIPGQFIDISQTGIFLPLGDDDEAPITTTVGNVVYPAGLVVVGNNGGVGFAPPSFDLPPENEPLGCVPFRAAAFGGGQAALPFWDNPGDKFGGVFWREQGVPGPRAGNVLIIQWHNRNIAGSSQTVTFQLQVFSNRFEGGTQVFGQFLYADIEDPIPNGGAIATIGHQDGNNCSMDVQWSFNTPGAVRNGTVLSVVPLTSVPTLSWPGLAILGLLLVGCGVLVLRRCAARLSVQRTG